MRIVVIGAGINNDGWSIRWSELYHILRTAAAPHIAYRCTITRIGASQTDPAKTALEWIEAGSRKSLSKIGLLALMAATRKCAGRLQGKRWSVKLAWRCRVHSCGTPVAD